MTKEQILKYNVTRWVENLLSDLSPAEIITEHYGRIYMMRSPLDVGRVTIEYFMDKYNAWYL